MANTVRLTRIELINTKKRIKVASRGLELLKMKRQSLVMEFFKISNEVRGLRENIKNDIEKGLNAIKVAEIIDGTLEIERISYMFSSPEIKIGGKNIMGVTIPEMSAQAGKKIIDDSYLANSVPVSIYDAITLFNKIFKELLEVSQKESSMRKLLNEIDKTNRRSNAIENIMIPRFNNNYKIIREHLDELERDSFATLKFVKSHVVSTGENNK
ncbi:MULTISPECIES: V-type ATP synthase subunit D [Ferroplasma]|uniref:A-type ATP synthase subunit D n=2 Tax=Ferroplasma TaxID=74968 RepID=S0ASB3_FERAC|nr:MULTISPECIES: V-type ATP synthase subunit D [Ferroplasma]AGO60914.1 V-type ATP synthase subunit D [Ferroplasma acidarmanus Fer1]WMT52794.1 MAG: V-type ATP synthase subunit D [Ferroplasma acidiphilum]